MADGASTRGPRMRELAFALCTAWLVMQNLILVLLFAWQPLNGIRIATLALLRVAIRAATPMTDLPGTGIIDAARVLLAAGTGVFHV